MIVEEQSRPAYGWHVEHACGHTVHYFTHQLNPPKPIGVLVSMTVLRIGADGCAWCGGEFWGRNEPIPYDLPLPRSRLSFTIAGVEMFADLLE